MPKNIELFKGGFSTYDNGVLRETRLAPNQRPADGHLKSGTWEDHNRVNVKRFKCQGADLEVGDVIGIHTTLTFGIIEALGIAVLTEEEGLKFKIVVSDASVDLSSLDFTTYEYNDADGKFTEVASGLTVATIDDIGDSQKYYAGYQTGIIRVTNAVQIGLEVVALPPGGLNKTFDIESRLHMRQVVRPPACLACC